VSRDITTAALYTQRVSDIGRGRRTECSGNGKEAVNGIDDTYRVRVVLQRWKCGKSKKQKSHWISLAYPPHTPNRRLLLVNLEQDMQISQTQHIHKGEPLTVKFSYFSCLLIATAVEIPPILRFRHWKAPRTGVRFHEVLDGGYIFDRLTQCQ